MKRSSSAPCLAEEQYDSLPKRIKGCKDREEGPNTREYLQLALARVLQLQRALIDDTYFNDDQTDFGELDNEDNLMRHVLTKVFQDLPGSSRDKVSAIIEHSPRMRYLDELAKFRAKSIQLSGYDTCRKVAIGFMKKKVNAEKSNRFSDPPAKTTLHRRPTGNADTVHDIEGTSPIENSNYKLRLRMLTSLDLHLATKQRDYTARLMRH